MTEDDEDKDWEQWLEWLFDPDKRDTALALIIAAIAVAQAHEIKVMFGRLMATIQALKKGETPFLDWLPGGDDPISFQERIEDYNKWQIKLKAWTRAQAFNVNQEKLDAVNKKILDYQECQTKHGIFGPLSEDQLRECALDPANNTLTAEELEWMKWRNRVEPMPSHKVRGYERLLEPPTAAQTAAIGAAGLLIGLHPEIIPETIKGLGEILKGIGEIVPL